ncbi:hypothetical protein [Umezawaea tangerina]|uniref:Uncharacterized protein n=1 Tax=Umezawaea tangerina TaxID=84725 RepID=A0A2T0SPE0_9PSEU|nr:hypothetical protein [Umezawaea tangerina]PRY35275.1 hypothetical protein CLV43_114193 [Umezawaea tangerina]
MTESELRAICAAQARVDLQLVLPWESTENEKLRAAIADPCVAFYGRRPDITA